MKIVFICGSVEPGRDGVGDYTRRLAIELQHQGHQVYAVALNDYYITEITSQRQVAVGGYLDVLRLPFTMKMSKKKAQLEKAIDTFRPDWISLQYVPYAFDPRGLPFLIGELLRKVKGIGNLHIMFHELWIESRSAELKEKCIAFIQKKLIQSLIQNLHPAVLHTQLPYNSNRLQKLGHRVNILPLFSNIPVEEDKGNHKNDEVFTIGIFSQVDVVENLVRFLEELGKDLKKEHLLTSILLIGGNEKKMLHLKDLLEQHTMFRGQVSYTGFLDETQISTAIKSCKLGLTAVPRHVLGKSGSVSAFLSYGIPVAAPVVKSGYCDHEIGFTSGQLVHSIMLEPDYKSFLKASQSARLACREIEIGNIAVKFMNDLEGAAV